MVALGQGADKRCPMLNFDHVAKRYPDGTVALTDVTFRVPRGQFCAIIGPSGAGKSTLLRLINGMIEPTGGTVELDGEAITRHTLPSVQRRIGMIHQQLDLVPRLTVLDNVMSGAIPALSTLRVLARLWPMSDQRRACRLLDQVGLAQEHLYRRASDLSGGQQQRVAIARAFILDPAVVLADEPVSSLDPTMSRTVLELIKQTSRHAGATVLCSLHQIELATEFADRIIAIRDGSVAFDGTADALTDDALDAIYDSRADADGRNSATGATAATITSKGA